MLLLNIKPTPLSPLLLLLFSFYFSPLLIFSNHFLSSSFDFIHSPHPYDIKSNKFLILSSLNYKTILFPFHPKDKKKLYTTACDWIYLMIFTNTKFFSPFALQHKSFFADIMYVWISCVMSI